MDNIVREGEQFLGNEEGNQGGSQGMDQSTLMGGQQNAQEGQQSQQGQSDQQGGGMMKSFEQNTGDAYVNQGERRSPFFAEGLADIKQR
jgi:hypothetical protein